MYSVIKSISKSPYFFIQGQFMEMNQGLVSSILSGQADANVTSHLSTQENWISPTLIDRAGNTTKLYEEGGQLYTRNARLVDLREGEYALGLNLNEVILKYGAPCAEGGMIKFAQVLNNAKLSSVVKSVIIFGDSPGGAGDGAMTLFDAVKDLNAVKPVFTYVTNGGIYSAAYWGLVPSTKIYASKGSDGFGSIGGYYTILDYRKHYEDAGVKIHQIYAPQSTGKNKPVRDLFDKEDSKALEEGIKVFVDRFINDVATHRNISSKDADWAKGYEYTYEKAYSEGLVDGIVSFKELLAEALPVAGLRPNSDTSFHNNSNFNKTTMANKNLAIFAAVLGYALTVDKDGGVYFNAEEQEKLSTHFGKQADDLTALTTSLEDVKIELTSITDAKTKAEDSVTELTQKVATQAEEITRLEALTVPPTTPHAGGAGSVNDEEPESYVSSVTAEAQKLFNSFNPITKK